MASVVVLHPVWWRTGKKVMSLGHGFDPESPIPIPLTAKPKPASISSTRIHLAPEPDFRRCVFTTHAPARLFPFRGCDASANFWLFHLSIHAGISAGLRGAPSGIEAVKMCDVWSVILPHRNSR